MNEDKIIQKLLEHDGRFENIERKMADKDDVNGLLNGQDKMITILMRIDQERVFTNERIKRLEREIEQIKLQLQVA